jgi:hypothetical protein
MILSLVVKRINPSKYIKGGFAKWPKQKAR